MAITQEQVKSIRQELDSLKPEAATAGSTELTVKQTIMALAPTLERMKKRGFEQTEIVAKLHDKGIEVKPPTLAKYLAEARRQKEARKNKRQAASPHCSAPGTACRNAGSQAADTAPPSVAKITENAKNIDIDKKRHAYNSGFAIRPDTPLDEL